MKNMFGKAKKAPKKRKQVDESALRRVSYRMESLEQQLQGLISLCEQTLQERESTVIEESLEAPEDLSLSTTEEIETISHGENETVEEEPSYILLPEPALPRQKSIEILEKEAVKHVQENRREIIKEKIEEELRRKELSAKELKILIVDEHEYCSKATFYRYLESMRKSGRIDSIKINGKEYLCSIASRTSPSDPLF